MIIKVGPCIIRLNGEYDYSGVTKAAPHYLPVSFPKKGVKVKESEAAWIPT